MFFGTLNRKNEKVACFWQVGMLKYGHVDYDGMHGMPGTRFGKLGGEECMITYLKQCPVCFSVTKMGCSNKACLKKDGSKQVMIRVNQRSTSKVNAGK